MKTFAEFLEAYGFEDDPNVESLDQELYGIRETIKNALAGGTLVYQWGDLEMRIRKLAERRVDQKRLEKVITYYQSMTNEITRTYRELQDQGVRGEPTVGNKFPIRSEYGNETVGDRVRQTLSHVHDIFDVMQKELAQMGSASHRM